MRIKFKAPDPRAGTIAQMDSSRGQFFIDNGSAVQVKDVDADAVTEAVPGAAPAPAPVAASAPAFKPTAKGKK